MVKLQIVHSCQGYLKFAYESWQVEGRDVSISTSAEGVDVTKDCVTFTTSVLSGEYS